MRSAPALAKASRYGSQGSIIRWQSKGLFVCGRNAATTGGPKVMLGTKWPSITSRWIQSAPAAATARTSSPSFEKSDDRIEGAMITGLDTRGVLLVDQPAGRWRCGLSMVGQPARVNAKGRRCRDSASGLLSIHACNKY